MGLRWAPFVSQELSVFVGCLVTPFAVLEVFLKWEMPGTHSNVLSILPPIISLWSPYIVNSSNTCQYWQYTYCNIYIHMHIYIYNYITYTNYRYTNWIISDHRQAYIYIHIYILFAAERVSPLLWARAWCAAQRFSTIGARSRNRLGCLGCLGSATLWQEQAPKPRGFKLPSGYLT
jgi:hypothetical protein